MMILAALSFIIGFVLVGILASKANRSVVGWILLSFLVSPLLASLVLYFTNPDEEFKKKKGLGYLALLIFIIGLFVGAVVMNTSSDSQSSQLEIAESSQTGAVCITSFENNSSLDYKVQVQNNTDQEIKRVDFRIVYYDNDGHQIDYHDSSNPYSIDAHMTRTLIVHKDSDAPRKYGKATIQLTDYSYISSFSF